MVNFNCSPILHSSRGFTHMEFSKCWLILKISNCSWGDIESIIVRATVSILCHFHLIDMWSWCTFILGIICLSNLLYQNSFCLLIVESHLICTAHASTHCSVLPICRNGVLSCQVFDGWPFCVRPLHSSSLFQACYDLLIQCPDLWFKQKVESKTYPGQLGFFKALLSWHRLVDTSASCLIHYTPLQIISQEVSNLQYFKTATESANRNLMDWLSQKSFSLLIVESHLICSNHAFAHCVSFFVFPFL